MIADKKIGLILLVVGILCLALGSLKFKSQKEVLKVAGFRATATTERTVPALRYVGAALIGGGGLIAAFGCCRRPG